jgi:hypothetical protein
LVAGDQPIAFTPATANRLCAKHTPDSRHSRPAPRSHFWPCVDEGAGQGRGGDFAVISCDFGAARAKAVQLVIASEAKQSRIAVLKEPRWYLSLIVLVRD